MTAKPRFKVGDTVYGLSIRDVRRGTIKYVIPARSTERNVNLYLVDFAPYAETGRYEDELFATEEEAREENAYEAGN